MGSSRLSWAGSRPSGAARCKGYDIADAFGKTDRPELRDKLFLVKEAMFCVQLPTET
jgi:hypothetical protein